MSLYSVLDWSLKKSQKQFWFLLIFENSASSSPSSWSSMLSTLDIYICRCKIGGLYTILYPLMSWTPQNVCRSCRKCPYVTDSAVPTGVLMWHMANLLYLCQGSFVRIQSCILIFFIYFVFQWEVPGISSSSPILYPWLVCQGDHWGNLSSLSLCPGCLVLRFILS